MRPPLLIILILLLAACSTQPSLPPALWHDLQLPQTLHIERDDGQNWLLVMQDEDGCLRFSLFNPLGVPLARQRLVDGRWRSDGLLPPDHDARELFSALLRVLSASAPLPAGWQAQWQQSGVLSLQRRRGHRYQISTTSTFNPAR